MAAIFYVLGAIGAFVGVVWAGFTMAAPAEGMVDRVVAGTPGLSLVGGSLLFLAIGGVLLRLDDLVRSNAAIAGKAGAKPSRGPALD